MSKNITFGEVVEKTLAAVDKPLSAREIWDKADELDTIGNFVTTGKTPWASINAFLYTNIKKNGPQSIFIQTQTTPALFALRKSVAVTAPVNKPTLLPPVVENTEVLKIEKYKERDLHKLLATFAKKHTHFKAYLKTIFHEISAKGPKGLNEWLHPDLVGVYFPFEDYEREVLEIQTHLSSNAVKIFSFEMKVNLDLKNLREYYFQAVSNSTWANEGYLVVLNINGDSNLKDEIRRLNNAFGIGLIKLNVDNIYDSEILFPARYKQEIDWDTVNRLSAENKDFRDFISELTEDIKLKRVKTKYDLILSDTEDIRKYIAQKGIK